MQRGLIGVVVLAAGLLSAGSARAAETYAVDPVHSSVAFSIRHMDVSSVHGRFNEVAGQFVIDRDDAANSSFSLTIKTDSVDTNNKARDAHLRSPDFFNAKQYGAITFKSTSVKPTDGGYEVTGDLTMHGVTKSITFTLRGGRVVEFPKGKPRTGFTTELTLRRGDFGVGKPGPMLGDDVHVEIGLEGVPR